MSAVSLGLGWICGGVAALYLGWPWTLPFAIVVGLVWGISTAWWADRRTGMSRDPN